MKKKRNGHKVEIIFIFLIYLLFSLVGIVSKYNAMTSKTWSLRFYCLLGVELCMLMIFTMAWQLLLKRFDLSFVYLFKGTTIMWGLFFAKIIFHEQITVMNLLGTMVIMLGIGVILDE